MKCQACTETATHHVTEIVAGLPVEYHVCDTHVHDLDTLEPAAGPSKPVSGMEALWADPEIREARRDPAARHKLAACLLPALCMALLDERPEVKIMAAFNLMLLGSDARSALEALRNVLQDQDARVRKTARIVLEYIDNDQDAPWFF